MRLHADVAVAFGRVRLLLSCEAHQAFVLQLHFQRLDRRDYHLDPQVEFEVVDEQGVVDVLREDVLRAVFEVRYLVGEEDAFALRLVGGFANLPLVGVFEHVLGQHATFVGQHVGEGDEVEGLQPLGLLHAQDVPVE